MKKKVIKKKAKPTSVKSKKSTKSTASKIPTIGLTPFADRILIRPFTQEEVQGNKANHYGIIIPDTVEKEKSAQGKVLAVGEGKWQEGKLIPVKVKVGEIVIFSKYGYDEVTHKGEELYLLKEDQILAIIK